MVELGKPLIEVRDVSKEFVRQEDGATVQALAGLSFTVKEGEIACILGPSGCGKTTILRLVAGLEMPDAGTISIRNREIAGPGADRGMVFQEFALFPWRTVRRNIEFGLELQGLGEEKRGAESSRLISLVGLSGFENAHPCELSGGMKQRVGLARALATSPEVLLMDEPFGSLDAQTRNAMQKELLSVWEKEKKTMLFVTHSVEEAVYLADRIIVLTSRPGKVSINYEIQITRPRDRLSGPCVDMRRQILGDLEREASVNARNGR